MVTQTEHQKRIAKNKSRTNYLPGTQKNVLRSLGLDPLTVQKPAGNAKKTKNTVLSPGLEGQSCGPLD